MTSPYSIEYWLMESIQKQLQVAARYIDHAEIPFQRRTSLARSYAVYRFDRGAGKGIALFVKKGPAAANKADVESFVGGLKQPEFFSPRYFGHSKVAGVPVAAWDYIDGRSPRFEASEEGHIARVVDAVAAMNALGASGVPKFVPVETPWIAPVAERVLRRLETDPPKDGPLLRKKLECFARAEDSLIARAKAMGDRWLSHHDMKPKNVIVRAKDNSLAVIDWPSTRVSLLGSGLRFLSGHEHQTALAQRYVQSMQRLGHVVDIDDVLFGINTTQLYWALCSGTTHNDIKRIRRGLDMWDMQEKAV